MSGPVSFLRGLAQGFAASLLGGVLVVVTLWALPEAWLGGIPLALRLIGSLSLLGLPGLLRVIHVYRAGRRRQAGATLVGCTVGAVLLALLGALFVAIAVGESLPRHD